MPNKTIDALVFCPFYVCEGECTISCEGILDGCVMVHRFSGKNDKLAHEADFCTSTACVNCPVFLALQGKYDERITPYGYDF